MNKKILFIVSIVLAISLVINGYLYATLVQTQNHASIQINALENERDSLTTEVATLITERDTALSQVATLSSERDSLQNERNYLTGEVSSLTTERGDLKTQVSSIVEQRDEALANVEILENQVIEIQNEIDALRNEILWEFGEDAWKTEQNGGSYDVQEILTLHSPDAQAQPRNYIEIYQNLDSSNGILISYEIKADTLGGFALKLAKNQPFFGSTACIAFEMGATQNEGKGFQISRWVNSWTWDTFAQPQEGVWYRVEINVQKTPLEVTYTIYQGIQFYGSATANDMTNLTFNDLQFVVLECWAGECQYQIRNFNIEYH